MQNPLRCFRCNVDGHVAVVCKREIPRCGECAGGHGTEDGVGLVDTVVSVNCRGVHVAGDRKCLLRERWVEVVRVVQRLSYAVAVKKVEEDGSRLKDPERIPVSSRFVPVQRDRAIRDLWLAS